MLTGKYLDGIPSDSRAGRPEGFLQSEQVEQQLDRIRQLGALADEAGMPLQHLALRWALQQKGVTSALIGARTVAQLDDCLDALKRPGLTKDLLERIDEIAPA